MGEVARPAREGYSAAPDYFFLPVARNPLQIHVSSFPTIL